MKKYPFFLLFCITLSGVSFGQTAPNELFNENNYGKVGQGLDSESSNELYLIWYRNIQDTTYTLKKAFFDSSCTKMFSKSFYKDNLLTGPFQSYTDGALTFQGYYKQGKLDGETLTYYKGKIIQRAHYTEGNRSGTWEEFDLEGKRTKKNTYDEGGRLLSVEKSSAN